ncbi:hypothetical protein PTW35_21365 (plasmid) [Photobacterium sp. DA100]|uniref:hypothetical protein n=1 Tax=Photobacterium sp. DA100 TaxID=3027472 RepID=UPI002479F667|nr:hypothetical protein [Photobacterium sp. DA100]WEM45624.1 hypothetical protein PTW35_21365 [Photobacterium sp. DA100]
MNINYVTIAALVFCHASWSGEPALGNSLNKMVRMQTVDPLAENRVPLGSPTFSGKKASKSFLLEKKGTEQKKVKSKDIISGIGD